MATKRIDQSPPEAQNDEFAGYGGSYLVVDGKRVLKERTLDPDDPNHEARKRQPKE